jgi:thiol-disulfide isomerase/thioredoxin
MESVQHSLHAFTEIQFLHNKELISSDILTKVNVIGLLFSASWCPPCQSLEKDLINFYTEINKNEKVFEIIQISNEKTEKEFDESANNPWLYVPFNDGFMYELVEDYNVKHLPTFIIVNKERTILSEKGRKDFIDLGSRAFEKWYKEYRIIRDGPDEGLEEEVA